MRPIDADALMEYCNNLKNKTIDANDIARFPTAYGWISVKERLPKKDVKVLAYWRNEITIADYCNGDWFDWIGDDETRDITYWMPLPEPPKVGDDE